MKFYYPTKTEMQNLIQMDGTQAIERRRYYRLEYPVAERPKARYKGRDYRVSEVSEGGAKILLAPHCEVRPGQFFAAVIRFNDGGIVPVVGVVLRHDKREMVIKFTIGISFTRMMAEQVRIRKKYPMFFDKD